MIEVRVRLDCMEPKEAVLLCTCETVAEAMNVAEVIDASDIFFEYKGRRAIHSEKGKVVGQFVVTDKWAGLEVILEATE